jgi:hypothetical protein
MVAVSTLLMLLVCEVMGGGWSFAFTLIPRTGVQGHTNCGIISGMKAVGSVRVHVVRECTWCLRTGESVASRPGIQGVLFYGGHDDHDEDGD